MAWAAAHGAPFRSNGLAMDATQPTALPATAPTRSQPILRLMLGLVLGCAGAAVFVALQLPLPWFLGALTATLIASVLDLPIAPPKTLGVVLRAVLGVAIGAAFTPELLSRGMPMLVSLLGLLPWLALLIGGGYWFFTRRALLDPMTAFFASVPGGLSDMVLMSEEMGANARAVTLIQLSRNVLVVFALPLYLQWHEQVSVARQAFAANSHISDLSPTGAVELLVLGFIGASVAIRLGVAGGAIVGPMVLSGTLHVLGLTTASVPFEIMTPTQILLGILLGAQFRGLTWLEFRTTLSSGLLFTALLLVAAPLMSAAVAHFSGFSPALTLMGFAPGGQAEINILAFAMHVDVAFVAVHHLVRVFLVMLAAQAMVRWHRTRRGVMSNKLRERDAAW